jgi:hypothetical protein
MSSTVMKMVELAFDKRAVNPKRKPLGEVLDVVLCIDHRPFIPISPSASLGAGLEKTNQKKLTTLITQCLVLHH